MIASLSSMRIAAVALKEFIQLRRDRLTFGMIVGVPLLQLMMFGYAINSDPKHLPSVAVVSDPSPVTRSIVAAMVHSEYFDFVAQPRSAAEGEHMLARGDAQFMVEFPSDFTQRLLRGEHPSMLLSVDATDPGATGNAVQATASLPQNALKRELTGPVASLAGTAGAFDVVVHRRYNPEGQSSLNIVPGLIGTILTMTMVMMTAIAVTRERERGTMESLLATPVRPSEVMIGKIAPYVFVGFTQVMFILAAARVLFGVPFEGSLLLLAVVTLLFIVANLALGFTFSTLAKNQLQAMQMSFFFLLPSILLSGFMFPFRGMPRWAQWIGEALPVTHFLRVIRGVLLKGNDLPLIWPEVWPILVFLGAATAVALARYRTTLD